MAFNALLLGAGKADAFWPNFKCKCRRLTEFFGGKVLLSTVQSGRSTIQLNGSYVYQGGKA